MFDPRHRANVWRLIADDLEMPVDRVVPTDNEIAKKEVMAAQMQAMQAQAGAGAKAA